MSFTLGVYDLFAYAIPGSLYGTLLYYVSARAGWIHRDGVDAKWPRWLMLWANLRLLELCYWLPSVAALDPPPPSS